jgi:secretion/DNA translocation related TadE-like protein
MLAAGLVAALVTITLGGVWLGAAQVARHRAQAVADLAAVAAAGRLVLGPDIACQQARDLAVVMKAAIRACDVEELDVVVTIAVRMGGWINSEARAAARAGPAGTVRS